MFWCPHHAQRRKTLCGGRKAAGNGFHKRSGTADKRDELTVWRFFKEALKAASGGSNKARF
jgi:hypothetical protein